MSGSLLLLGCGGHGRVVADVALDCGYDSIAFLDDVQDASRPRLSFPVLGPIAMMGELSHLWPVAMAAVGNNSTRLELFHRLRQAGFATPAVIHPSAVVSRNAHIADGVFVAPGAVINTGAHVGEATIVNTGARIDHDCIIAAGCHIAPGATLSGEVSVGEKAWLGTGCSVRQRIIIADEVVVGVGSAVVSNLTRADVYVGVPARPRSKHK